MAVVVHLTGDTKDLEAALSRAGVKVQDVGEKAEKAEKSSGKFGSALGGVAKIAGGFVVGQALLKAPGVMMDLSNAARDLELQQKKANIVFGDQIGIVEEWADANAKSMGLTNREATSLAAGMADLLVPMGMSREAAAKMSTETLSLSGALAEWSGGQKSASDVAAILQSAYLGETDGLKGLGIAISAADVQTRLAEKGQKDLTGAAQQQAQALAIQELIMEKSTDAQTAFANGADSAARKQAEMNATVAQAKEDLAVAMGPAIAFVTTKLAELVPVVIEGARVFAEEMKPRVMEFVDAAVPVLKALGQVVAEQFAKFRAYYEADIKPALENIRAGIAGVIAFVVEHWPEIEKVVRPVMDQVVNIITVAKDIISGVLKILIDLIGGDFSGAWENLKQLVADVWRYIRETIENAIALIKGLAPLMLEAGKALGGAMMDGIKEALGAVAGFASDVGKAVLEALKRVINEHIIDNLNSKLDITIPGKGPLPDIHLPGPKIPHLAAGGVVKATPGGVLALLGEGGQDEAVIPLSSANAKGGSLLGIGLGGAPKPVGVSGGSSATGITNLSLAELKKVAENTDKAAKRLDALDDIAKALKSGSTPVGDLVAQIAEALEVLPEMWKFQKLTMDFTAQTAEALEALPDIWLFLRDIRDYLRDGALTPFGNGAT